MVQPSLPPRPQPESQPPIKRSRKIAGSLLALSSAAIVSVYTVGYVNGQSSLQHLEAVVATPVPAATTPVPAASRPAGSTLPAASPTPAASGAGQSTQSLLRDGTFTGTGTSRHGSIQASVVISGGKIVSASVTSCMTRYPCSDVEPLIRAAVQGQGVPTSNVSGATDSSRAYKQAFSSALTQARSAG